MTTESHAKPQGGSNVLKATALLAALLIVCVSVLVATTAANAEPEDYDTNANGILEKNEVLAVIIDYFRDRISKDDVLEVLVLYFLSEASPEPTPTPVPTSTPTPMPEPTQTSASSQEDVTAPEIVGLSLTPMEVDVGYGPGLIALSVKGIDDSSGIDWISATLTSPSGEQTHCFCNGLPLSSGTYINGTFTRSIAIPRYSEAGTWTIEYINIVDSVNNRRNYSAGQLAVLGLDHTFEVSTSQEDVTGPELVEVTLTPMEVDVSDGPGLITLSVKGIDDSSGIDWISATLTSPSGEQTHCFCNGLPLSSGTYTDGVFTRSITIPQYSEAGTWTIEYINVVDSVNNSRNYGVGELVNLGLSPSFEVSTTKEDVTTPEIVGVTLTPTEVNVSDGPGLITMSIEATDDLSGIDWISATLTSPSGEQTHCFCNGLPLTSGSHTDGVFTRSITLPQYSEAGTWSIDYININDSVNNSQHYSAGRLTNLGLASYFEVVVE